MGNKKSSHADKPSKEEQEVTGSMKVTGERGRSIEQKKTNVVYNESLEEDSLVEANQFEQNIGRIDPDSDSDYSSSDESDDEDDEEDIERFLVLEDAKKLKALAKAFLHPEASVTVDGTATARCYFDRNSANVQEDVESAEDRNAIMEDMKNLRASATFYLHPELGVVTTDPTTFGRNYFSRPSSVAQEDVDDAEERAHILADAAFLKKLAVDYAHPELGVVTTDPTACGRNHFSKPSSVVQEDVDDADERARILADAAALKRLAVDYAHPELGVSMTDPTAFGRNYFTMRSIGKPLEGLNVNMSKPQENIFTMSNKQPVTSKLSDGKDGLHSKLSEIDTSHVTRSPSTVILFGLGDDDGSAY